MATEYKMIADGFCLTGGQTIRRVEKHLNDLAQEGWELAAYAPVRFFGTDVGFNLVLKRSSSGEENRQ